MVLYITTKNLVPFRMIQPENPRDFLNGCEQNDKEQHKNSIRGINSSVLCDIRTEIYEHFYYFPIIIAKYLPMK